MSDNTHIEWTAATRPNMAAALRAALVEIDAEIEKRKSGGNAEAWADLQKISDDGHAALEHEREGWKHISTAPRDGTHILIAFGQDHVSVGSYHRNDDDPYPWKFMDSQGEGLPIFNGARDDQYGPSKWRPLPSAPGGEGSP